MGDWVWLRLQCFTSHLTLYSHHTLRFQAALVEYGVNKDDIFQTNDLSEKKDVANVTNTLYALGRAV